MSEPCNWGVTVENCAAYDGLSPEKQAEVVSMATDFLWNWTGRMFGVCQVTVRPCRQNCTSGRSSFMGAGPMPGWVPVLLSGKWYSLGCGSCQSDDCSCATLSQLKLPGPVQSVTEVLIDGVALAPVNYRVDNENMLVRTDGGRWPTCQDMAANPETDPDTFMITYERGIPVPAGGLRAASILACQFSKAIATPKDCALPERMKNITRQGVSVTLLDDFKSLGEGQTGIWMIDSWVASVMKPKRPSRVYSPDVPNPKNRRTTWTAP